jgi:hypothetical protein
MIDPLVVKKMKEKKKIRRVKQTIAKNTHMLGANMVCGWVGGS